MAGVLARVLDDLPGTFAGRQMTDRVPGNEAGWIAFGRHLGEQEQAVRARRERIEEIGRELDRMAWELYRPKGAGVADAL
jgi:hypothetical protein